MAESLRVLVVDGDASSRLAIRRAVEAGMPDARVDDRGPADVAGVLSATPAYDCAIIGDDLDLARALRATGGANTVLLVTSSSAEEVVQAAADAGVADYIHRNDVTPKRLTLRVQFATRVARAEADAKRATATRDDVLAVVSHDLRGPLHAIGLATEALRDEVPEGAKRYLAAIDRASARAERLITDLLEASAIENGALALAPAAVDAVSIVRQAAQDHDLAARETGTQITAHVPTGSLVVRADRDRVLQVLGNLIGNALKHAKGTPIDVSLSEDERVALIAVRDHGPGITPSELPHVFDRYWRGRTRKGGAGLGLAIAKGIVTAHGGELRVRSQPGDGSEFTFTLPLAR
jgi:signal transduction histidine kinase|nr:ATP-binding protein [Kofleriaceae bacterium]